MQVMESDSFGRGLFATRKILAGEVILRGKHDIWEPSSLPPENPVATVCLRHDTCSNCLEILQTHIIPCQTCNKVLELFGHHIFIVSGNRNTTAPLPANVHPGRAGTVFSVEILPTSVFGTCARKVAASQQRNTHCSRATLWQGAHLEMGIFGNSWTLSG
jgi:hypothetical protein